MPTAAKFAIVLLVALAFTVLPGGGSGIEAVLDVLLIAFFVAIALLGYRLYREHRFTVDSLEPQARVVLYGSIGLACLTFTASRVLFDVGGIGVVAWLALLGLASYGVYWVYARSRAYE